MNEARENLAANKAAYRAWVHTRTPLEIYQANVARRALGHMGLKVSQSKLAQIKDDRFPKAPSSPFNFFIKMRYESGDMTGTPVKEAARPLRSEWNSLSESDRQVCLYLASIEAASVANLFNPALYRHVSGSCCRF
jgi:hypothetical protein